MSLEENKAIVRRYYEELNKGNLDVADEVFAPNYIHREASGEIVFQGLEEDKRRSARNRTVLPDVQWTVEDMVAEGDKVVVRLTFRGTHRGELRGIAPTGKELALTGIVIFRLAGGKIEQRWGSYDSAKFWQQLGVSPPPAEGEEQPL